MNRAFSFVNGVATQAATRCGHRELRVLFLVLAVAIMMQLIEPLAQTASIAQVIVYWCVRLCLLGAIFWLTETVISRWLKTQVFEHSAPQWLTPTVLTPVAACFFLTFVELFLEANMPVAEAFADDDALSTSPLLAFATEYMNCIIPLAPLNAMLWYLIDKPQTAAPLPPRQDTVTLTNSTVDQTIKTQKPEFLHQLPGITADQVHALKAEEHYLRIYTGKDSKLVHYRISTAAEELGDDLGLRVHRSWWVAKNAVERVDRSKGRYRLRLINDIDVPVGDKYVGVARETGLLSS